MSSEFHRAKFEAERVPAAVSMPLWTRWLVLAFALVFSGVTTAQAAHLHRPAKSGHEVQAPPTGSPTADNEEHCPLCVAMHPALPVSLHVSPAPSLQLEQLEGLSPCIPGAAVWHFAQFSRPPPVRG